SLPPLFLSSFRPHRALHSFPTRRSSDLVDPESLRRGRQPRSANRCDSRRSDTAPDNLPPVHTANALQTRRQFARPLPSKRSETRSEEHTSELQSLTNLVCRLLLVKQKPS